MNVNFSSTQFYNIAIGLRGQILGGTQDNSMQYLEPKGSNVTKQARDLFSGDGGYGEISRLIPGVLMVESQHGNMARSSDNGETFSGFLNLDRMDPNGTIGTSAWSNWIAPFHLWEKLDDPLSTDSLRYGTDSISFNLGFGTGGTTF
ncbi:MAG: hypothetical protein U5L96_05380 [Owenweeksia sp.]|nr:hypothetical protein [Owenweeksia sp.]